jgi:hypothetical protein
MDEVLWCLFKQKKHHTETWHTYVPEVTELCHEKSHCINTHRTERDLLAFLSEEMNMSW